MAGCKANKAPQEQRPRRRVLLIIEQCNPEWASVPLVGYEFFNGISALADVTLVTHQRNQQALEKVRGQEKIVYIQESAASAAFYRQVAKISSRGGVNWPLHHALSYPLYAEFNRGVYQAMAPAVQRGDFDLVHALTPMIPRYPYKIIRACQNTPFILGPVNGGVPFPKNFRDVAWKEFAHYNFLRLFTHLIPGYAATYRRADYVLAGSRYTLAYLQRTFHLSAHRVELLPENGLSADFFQEPQRETRQGPVQLLFVGRLVPYKGADILLDALARLPAAHCGQIELTVVGDGPERQPLTEQVQRLGLTAAVRFVGWVAQKQTREYYAQADLFCFPSIREFGGAVVLEAMASGLPCLVADHGGVAEYVTSECGVKIAPRNREYLVAQLAAHIDTLSRDRDRRLAMGVRAQERARQFTWEAKACQVAIIYEKVLQRRGRA
ncbi:MAG: glycosyltransferase family 4 protein [Desulfobacca sp.]|uniref:glycosyltransferase family 4 protein n=1 Tax=Desulfobacca sp. TaxID=2067990 RepID=UPI00404A3D56